MYKFRFSNISQFGGRARALSGIIPKAPMQMLFLCTDNNHLSRFAEEYFNYQIRARSDRFLTGTTETAETAETLTAQQTLLKNRIRPWTAFSAGLARDIMPKSPDRISLDTQKALMNLGIKPCRRWPVSARNVHFTTADLIYAVDKKQHLPMVNEYFANHAYKVKYLIGDMHKGSNSRITFEQMVKAIDSVIDEIVSM